MDNAAEFHRLLAGLRAGDPAALDQIARQYGPVLRAAVRRKLHPQLRSRLDSLDVVQDVWMSFLAIPPDRLQFDSPRALVAYLTQVAFNRTVEVFRERFHTKRDDIGREAESDRGAFIQACTPSPSMTMSASEEWEQLVGQFPEGHRVILRRLREGHELSDIARMAKVSLSTVNRVVRRLKEMTGV